MEAAFKDELFYHLITSFFDQLKKLNLSGAEKWKHVEGYSQCVSIVMGELKKKDATNYSSGLVRASLSLLTN